MVSGLLMPLENLQEKTKLSKGTALNPGLNPFSIERALLNQLIIKNCKASKENLLNE